MALFKRKAKSEKAAGQKQGQMKVLKDAFALVRKHQPIALLWMALSFVVVLSIGVILGLQFNHPIYFTIISFPIAFLFAFFIFYRNCSIYNFTCYKIKPSSRAFMVSANSALASVIALFALAGGETINVNERQSNKNPITTEVGSLERLFRGFSRIRQV